MYRTGLDRAATYRQSGWGYPTFRSIGGGATLPHGAGYSDKGSGAARLARVGWDGAGPGGVGWGGSHPGYYGRDYFGYPGKQPNSLGWRYPKRFGDINSWGYGYPTNNIYANNPYYANEAYDGFPYPYALTNDICTAWDKDGYCIASQ